MQEGRRERGGGSQGRPEVEMNDCENLLRAKPQPAGVQIDRTDTDTDTGVCVPHLQLAGWALQAEKSTRREKERGGQGVTPNKAKCILWCVAQTTSLNKLMHGSHNKKRTRRKGGK